MKKLFTGKADYDIVLNEKQTKVIVKNASGKTTKSVDLPKAKKEVKQASSESSKKKD